MINIAVIGLGLLGMRHARVFSEQPEVRLCAVIDVDRERATAAAAKFGARAFTSLEDALAAEAIDAVAVATPDHVHRAPVLTALAAGKHVFMEKPIATDIDDARAIVQAAARAATVVVVNFSQRYLSDYAWIKRAIDAGDIGEPRMVTSVKFDTLHVPTGMLSWAASSSPFYFMSSHDIDLTCWYLGRRPTRVFAMETRGVLDARGVAVHDGVNALIAFDDGIMANFHSSWIHPNTYPAVADGTLQVIGTDGAIFYNNRLRRIEFHNSRTAQEITFSGPATATEVGGKLVGAFTDSVRAFVRCVEERCEPMTSPRHTLVTSEIQHAAGESLRTGQPVAIGPAGG